MTSRRSSASTTTSSCAPCSRPGLLCQFPHGQGRRALPAARESHWLQGTLHQHCLQDQGAERPRRRSLQCHQCQLRSLREGPHPRRRAARATAPHSGTPGSRTGRKGRTRQGHRVTGLVLRRTAVPRQSQPLCDRLPQRPGRHRRDESRHRTPQASRLHPRGR